MKPNKTGIIHLWDLPENEVYLDLEKSYKFQMLQIAKGLFGSWNELSRKLNLPIDKHRSPTYFRGIRRKQSASLWLFKKLSDFLVSYGYNQFCLKNLERKVILLKFGGKMAKSVYKPKFPFNFNSKSGAIIISAILHDGGMDRIYSEPYYSNLNINMRKRVLTAIIEVVGNVHFTETYKQIQFPKILGVIFKSIGLKAGRKTLNNPKIPNFVFDTCEKIKAEYISQAIADDGNVQYNPKRMGYVGLISSIDVTNFSKMLRAKIKKENIIKYAPNILKGAQRLLKELEIDTEGPYCQVEYSWVNKEKLRYTQQWRIMVRKKKAVKTFFRKIKLPMNYKQENLRKLSNF